MNLPKENNNVFFFCLFENIKVSLSRLVCFYSNSSEHARAVLTCGCKTCMKRARQKSHADTLLGFLWKNCQMTVRVVTVQHVLID